MLKIWGRDNSVNVKKALWCLDELGLQYERTDAGMQYGVVNTPEYRKMNPNGLVPTMDEDGFILWESHSIVRYLAAKHGKGVLWPMDERTRAIAEPVDGLGVLLPGQRARRLLEPDPHAAGEARREGDRGARA